ncbi:MAG: glycosyltransferase [Armatimonadetes bacterium]|nr:glycosyltransferase [Armatimonadota bacterium]
MRILIVHRNARIGGANTYILAVAPELIARGHEVHLLIGPGPLLPKLREAVQTRVIVAPPVRAAGSFVLRRAIRLRQIDVVNAHTVTSGALALAACRAEGVPLVQHAHSLIPLDEANPVLRGAGAVMVMNRSVQDWVGQVEGVAEKTFLSRLAVDSARFHLCPPHENGGFHVLYCGRMSRRKAAYAQDLLEMLAAVDKQIPGLRLTIVGGGSRQVYMGRTVRAANAGLGREAVRYAGETLDTAPLIASADCVIGAGYVALEALATGRHTIGVGIQGLTGYVTRENLEASIEANFGDHDAFDRNVTADSLAAQVLAAYAAWQREKVLGWASEAIGEEFCVARACDDLERVYASVAGR